MLDPNDTESNQLFTFTGSVRGYADDHKRFHPDVIPEVIEAMAKQTGCEVLSLENIKKLFARKNHLVYTVKGTRKAVEWFRGCTQCYPDVTCGDVIPVS